MLLVEITLAKGAKVPAHTHPNDQVGYLVKGSFRMKIGGTDHNLKAGDSYAISANVEHEVEVYEESIAIDVFSPPREDYGRDLEDRQACGGRFTTSSALTASTPRLFHSSISPAARSG